MDVAITFSYIHFDAEKILDRLLCKEFRARAIRDDTSGFHHDDAIDFGNDVAEMMRHE